METFIVDLINSGIDNLPKHEAKLREFVAARPSALAPQGNNNAVMAGSKKLLALLNEALAGLAQMCD